jgi:hypothetical protein
MSDRADFNEEASRVVREATALSKRLIVESKEIKATPLACSTP